MRLTFGCVVLFMSLGIGRAVAAPEPARIDLLIVYTPAARDAVGGASIMETLVVNCVAVTNAALARSGTDVVVNLVGVRLVPYAETGNALTDLSRLVTA